MAEGLKCWNDWARGKFVICIGIPFLRTQWNANPTNQTIATHRSKTLDGMPIPHGKTSLISRCNFVRQEAMEQFAEGQGGRAHPMIGISGITSPCSGGGEEVSE